MGLKFPKKPEKPAANAKSGAKKKTAKPVAKKKKR